MPDTKGYDTPFKDYTATKMPFTVVPTLGDNPKNFPVNSGDAHITGKVTPKELPENTLWHGPKM